MPNRAADEFARLVDIVARLRAPDGCPWDREQTIDTLKPFLLEEAYEALEAIDHHDHAALREELGDHVFEAVLLAQVESEAGYFTIADSLCDAADKLVRRHPHVFKRDETPGIDSADKVRVRWEEIKAQEHAAKPDAKPKTLLSGIASALPALLRAYQIGGRVASVGFDWNNAADVIAKIDEEVGELRAAVAVETTERAEEELGDLLFAIANLSRKLGIEPETALRKANDKVTKRFEAMERAIAASGRVMREMTLDELETEWQRVKSDQQTG